MERVDHVHVVEVGSSGFVSHIHGMFQREVPHRESLKLGISGFHAALTLVVNLTQAHSHLAATRSGRSDHYKRARGFGKVVAAETVVGINKFHIVGISVDGVVIAHLYAHTLKASTIHIGTVLAIVVGDYHIRGV